MGTEVLGLEMSVMASKTWVFGKKITLWGAVVSSLPFLFPALMFVSALSVAFAVPLGCGIASYICFRKVFSGFPHRSPYPAKGISGLEKFESGASVNSKLESPYNEAGNTNFSEENEDTSSEKMDQAVQPVRNEEEEPQSGENFDRRASPGNIHQQDTHSGETHEEKSVEGEIREEKAHEEEIHPVKFHEGETQSKLEEPHAILVEKPHEEKAFEGDTQLKSDDTHTISVEKPHEEQALELEIQLRSENPHAIPISKNSPMETKHKRKEEEEEEDESNGQQETPSKRSRHEEHQDFGYEPFTPFSKKNGDEKLPTPETTYYSARQAVRIGIPSPGRSSSMDSDFASIADELPDETTEIISMPSPSPGTVRSSQFESDQDSKSESEDSNSSEEDSDNEKKIWEEIDAVRKIVGYKGAPHPSYVEEIKALYVFTGVEPPESFKNSFDMGKAKEKLEFLKVVVGVK